MENKRCLQIATILKRLPNEVLFNIFSRCPREYLVESLLKDRYFMKQWYQTYYPYHYCEWKRQKGIKYYSDAGILVKMVDNKIIDTWYSPNHDLHVNEVYTGNYNINKTFSTTSIELKNGCYYYYEDGEDIYLKLYIEIMNGNLVKATLVYDLETDELLYITIFTLLTFATYKHTREGLIFISNDLDNNEHDQNIVMIQQMTKSYEDLGGIIDFFPELIKMRDENVCVKIYLFWR